MSDSLRFGRLPCDQPMARLIDQVADGHPQPQTLHQAACPHCQTALRELDRRWEPVRQLADEDVTIPPGLVDKIMRIIWRAAATGWHTLRHTARGVTRISTWIVDLIAQAAAHNVAGVHRATPAPPSAPAQPVEVGEQQTPVNLDLVADYGSNLFEVTDAVRRRIIADLHAIAGLDVAEINLHVVDIQPPPSQDE